MLSGFFEHLFRQCDGSLSRLFKERFVRSRCVAGSIIGNGTNHNKRDFIDKAHLTDGRAFHFYSFGSKEITNPSFTVRIADKLVAGSNYAGFGMNA